jgi:hypothetical protein
MTPELYHTASIIITVIGAAYYIHRDIKADMDKQTSRIEAQAARTDKLYEMFIDALHKTDEKFEKIDQKFYDLLKEQKR